MSVDPEAIRDAGRRASRHRVDLDPLAAAALDDLEAAMPRLGWCATRSDIVSALIYFMPAPTVVGLTREFNIQRAQARKAERPSAPV